jgi:hypothetical protein
MSAALILEQNRRVVRERRATRVCMPCEARSLGSGGMLYVLFEELTEVSRRQGAIGLPACPRGLGSKARLPRCKLRLVWVCQDIGSCAAHGLCRLVQGCMVPAGGVGRLSFGTVQAAAIS